MALIFLKIHFYTQRMQTILHFSLKDEKLAIELMKTFDIFSTFSRLKPSKIKCKIAGLGALKGVKLTLTEMECIDLMFNAVNILAFYYSYDKNFKNQDYHNYCYHSFEISHQPFLRNYY